jgi:transcriptional regulator
LDAPLALLQGTLDVLILQTLSGQPMHGYAVSRWIRLRSNEALAVEDAALYQALHRLERRGWIESEWGLSDTKRRAKYYALTDAGRAQLAVEAATWRRYVGAVGAVLDSSAPVAPFALVQP